MSCQDLVLDILNENVGKLIMSLFVPRFLEHINEVNLRLKGTEFANCAKMLKSYVEDKKANISGVQETGSTHYQEQVLVKIVDLFHENYEMLVYFPDWLGTLLTDDDNFIEMFSLSKDIADGHFKISARSALQDERDLHAIYEERTQILNGQQALDNITDAILSSEQDDKDINDIRDELQEKKEKLSNKLSVERSRCAGRMKQAHSLLDFQVKLKADLETFAEGFQKSKEKNVETLDAIRKECNKLCIQYQTALKKYDQTLSAKFKENLELNKEIDEFADETEQFRKFIYNPVKKVYDILITSKLEEEERKWLEKVDNFIRNRNARIIQLAYRLYLRLNKPWLLPKPVPKKSKNKKK